MTRRTFRAGAAVAVVVVLVAAVAAATAVVGMSGRADERTVTARSPRPTPARVIPYGLPSEGIAVEDGGAVVFLTVHGEVIHRLEGFTLGADTAAEDDIALRGADGVSYALDRHTGVMRQHHDDRSVPLAPGVHLTFDKSYSQFAVDVANDRDIVTHTAHGDDHDSAVAYDVRTGKVRPLPPGCRVADRHDTAWFLVCVTRETWMSSIVRLDADDTTTVLATEPHGGSWDAVMVSPDGRRLLTTASYDCGQPKVFVGETMHPAIASLGDVTGAAEEPDAIALGWTASGSAVFTAAGNCGPPLLAPGVYVLDGGAVRSIYTAAAAEDWAMATMWTAPPRPQPGQRANSSSRRS